jgi:carbonic anhydrase/acetyltransferase-like protein (isoleucine patch superfamily)
MSEIVIPRHARERPNIAPSAFVAANAVILGDVIVEAEASVWFGCVLRGDVQAIRVGPRTNIQDGTVVHGSTGGAPVVIGADVTVGHGTILHGCQLQDASFVGFGARVLDNAIVERGAMLAAGSVLTGRRIVPSGQLWGGNPARLLRKLTEEERASFPTAVERYVRLARSYRISPPAVFSKDSSK